MAFFSVMRGHVKICCTYANEAPAATATALPPELPPATNQSSVGGSRGGCNSDSNLHLTPDLHTFLVGPWMESIVPDLDQIKRINYYCKKKEKKNFFLWQEGSNNFNESFKIFQYSHKILINC